MLKKLLILMICAALLLAGCTNESAKKTAANNASNAEEKKIEITMFYPVAVGGPLTKIIDKLAEDFTKENPSITVNPVYTGSYADTTTKAQAAVQGKNSPDLAVILSTELFTLKDMNAIIPLDEFIEKDGGKDYLNDFYPGFLENAQAGGKTWSVPFQRSTIVMYYNKDAFRKANLDPEKPPKTWDELMEYSEKLTIRNGSGETEQWGVQIPTSGFPYWLFQAFAIQNGKNLMNADGTEVYFNTPENIEALQLWVDLAHKYKSMPEGVIEWKSVPSNFLEGKTAMAYHTTGNLTNIKNKADFDFGVAFMPASKTFGSPTGGGNFYIFKDIPREKQEAAWKFIKFATSPERTAEWSMGTGYIATRKSAYETEKMKKYVKDFPPAAVARDQLQYAKAELSTHNNGQVTKIFNDSLQSVLVGSSAPKEALGKAQKEAEKVLAPFKK